MDDQADQIRKQLPLFQPVLTVAVLLALAGWIGLLILVFMTVPSLGPRWLMFFCVTLAITGTFLPLIHYLHRRFPTKPAATGGVLVREALLLGVYADVLLWLQFGRALNFAEAAFIAVGLVAIEVLIRWRERVAWAPPFIEEVSPLVTKPEENVATVEASETEEADDIHPHL